MQTRTRWTIVGLVVGAAFLGLAVHQADFAASWDVLRTAHIGWAKAVLACGLLFMVIKALRWSIVLRPLSQCPQGFLLRTVFVGTAANLVVPHSGEVLRATLLARRQSLAPSAVLATIAIERILDFIALVILTAVALLIDPRVSPLLWSAGLISLALVVAGLLVVHAFMRPTERSRRWGALLIGLLPQRPGRWIESQIRRGVAGLASLGHPGTVIALVLMSLLQWSCIVGSILASALAVGAQIPVSGAIAVFVLTVIGLTLPSSPAQLGTTQLAFVAGMELVGSDPARAFAASLVYTGFVDVTMMVVGLLLWLRLDWSASARRA